MAGRRVEVAKEGLFVPGMGDLNPGRRFDAEMFGENVHHLIKCGNLRWVDDDKPAEKATTTKKPAASKPAAEG
jgi:hypothetical protein